MLDEQIERVLFDAKTAFVISEAMRPFRTTERLFQRLASHADAEECTAMVQVFTLAVERFKETAWTVNSVALVLVRSLRSDGLSRPPSVRAIARRLAVAPGAVEDALGELVKRGLVEELPPKGFMLRRRRFRFVSLDVHVFTSTTFGAGMSTTNGHDTE
jgi:DNA-binding MarR family transcriptional regulator